MEFGKTVMKLTENWNRLIRKKTKLWRLKKQINIHKETSKSTIEKQLFQFSSKGKQHDVQKLKQNLLAIFDHRIETMAVFQDPESFVGKIINHIWSDENTGQDTTYKGKIISFTNDSYNLT